jgi:hypothetical protein
MAVTEALVYHHTNLLLSCPRVIPNQPRTNVISTEAGHSLIVTSAAERSMHSVAPEKILSIILKICQALL